MIFKYKTYIIIFKLKKNFPRNLMEISLFSVCLYIGLRHMTKKLPLLNPIKLLRRRDKIRYTKVRLYTRIYDKYKPASTIRKDEKKRYSR